MTFTTVIDPIGARLQQEFIQRALDYTASVREGVSDQTGTEPVTSSAGAASSPAPAISATPRRQRV